MKKQHTVILCALLLLACITGFLLLHDDSIISPNPPIQEEELAQFTKERWTPEEAGPSGETTPGETTGPWSGRQETEPIPTQTAPPDTGLPMDPAAETVLPDHGREEGSQTEPSGSEDTITPVENETKPETVAETEPSQQETNPDHEVIPILPPDVFGG